NRPTRWRAWGPRTVAEERRLAKAPAASAASSGPATTVAAAAAPAPARAVRRGVMRGPTRLGSRRVEPPPTHQAGPPAGGHSTAGRRRLGPELSDFPRLEPGTDLEATPSVNAASTLRQPWANLGWREVHPSGGFST